MAREVIYLFRAEAASSDPFAARLQAAGYHPLVLPVLSVVWRNTAHLQAALAHPEVYDGLILTSPRAVEAVRRLGAPPAAWRRRRVYVVGPRTAAAARELGWTPRGEEAGSGLALARLILEEPWPSRPLLFLCGKQRRSELPEQLRTTGLPLEELVVYEIRPVRPVLPDDALAPDWVVFFSPSGWEAARHLPLDWHQVRVAAIGPTTATALQQKGVLVRAIARRPTPEGLLAAIQEATSLS